MAQIETVLEQVEGLIRSVKLQDAQERLASLLRTMGPAELRVWEPELSLTISRFLPKRRRQLGQLLQERLAGATLVTRAMRRPRRPRAQRGHPTPLCLTRGDATSQQNLLRSCST